LGLNPQQGSFVLTEVALRYLRAPAPILAL
jgi:hypothetical protein